MHSASLATFAARSLSACRPAKLAVAIAAGFHFGGQLVDGPHQLLPFAIGT